MRVLLRAKGWTLVVLVSLAVGIGANTALLSAINGLLIKTIPVADPDGLVRLRWTGDNDASRSNSDYDYAGTTAGGGRVSASFSYPMFEAMRDGNETLEGLAAATPFPQRRSDPDSPPPAITSDCWVSRLAWVACCRPPTIAPRPVRSR